MNVRVFSYKHYNQTHNIMGWTSFPMHEPVKDWFNREWNDDKREVLDVAIVQRNTLYAAIKIKETGQVFCIIYLLRWSRDVYNFSYKDLILIR